MEREKKRKRADHNHQRQVNGVGELRRKEKDEVPAPAPATMPVQPSEEEVEEFFTILRRMNVAIKYFDKGGTGRGGVNANGDGGKRMGPEISQVEGLKIGRERKIAENGGPKIGLDLNLMPESEI
ncbi:OLC1v1014214C1 [Oldenlandia corymbosa var. corymbosa]|uniref:OLC1v1014214C1 n=1 Tax=Oldenlandia corymbosa var. corymbosa TaxID=529605 RepID=A0AAV1E0B3_OLDCO|nr:OLC1v1014214C1 [Oldenlandia corymbosa var. corymbosa]